MASDEQLRELEEKYEGYKVYDNAGEKIGKVDDLFVDEQDREEYIGVKMGLFGMRSTLIPMDVARVNERERIIEVSESKDHVKDAPNFSDDDDITPDFEERIRSHFGLTGRDESTSRGSYGRSGGGATREGDTGLSSGDSSDDRELDVEGGMGAGEAGATRGGEGDRDRDDFSGSGSTGTTASGAPADLETGDRGGGEDMPDPYRQGYEEGLREAGREAARREAGGGTSGGGSSGDGGEARAASEHFGAPVAGPGEKEFDDMRDYQSASTGVQPSRGEAEDRPSGSTDRSGETGGGGERGERSEGGGTRVWRRLRG